MPPNSRWNGPAKSGRPFTKTLNGFDWSFLNRMRDSWPVRWVKKWWFWPDDQSPGMAVVRRWRRTIFSVALLMPFLSCAGVLVLLVLDHLSLYTVQNKGLSLPSTLMVAPILWLELIILNWPFFVFAGIITRRFQTYGSTDRNSRWASAGGFVGLFLPNAYWAGLMPLVLTSGAPDSAAAAGLLNLVAMIGGVALGSCGWFLGLGAAKALARLGKRGQ